MKIKKILAIVLSIVMLGTMSISAFAATYMINEFDRDYVICNEDFAGGKIHNSFIAAEGDYSLLDGGVELRAGGKIIADLAAVGKSIDSGIVDVSFSFTPSIVVCEVIDNVATQRFTFGDGFALEAKWTEYGSDSAWLKDGKFVANGEEIIKFNNDGTGSDKPGCFRSFGSESAAPSLYYNIDAKINLDAGKIYLTITEEETTTNGVTDYIIINNREFDYAADTFTYFSNSLTSTDEYIQFFSYNYHLDISVDGDASYEGVVGAVTRTYSDEYTFQKDSHDYLTLEPDGNYTHFVDLSEKAVTSGIVDISYRFWPTMETGTNYTTTATQTFEFGPGFKFNAQWTTLGQDSTWLTDGKFNIGDQTVIMNSSRWNIGDFPAGYFRAYNIWDNGIVWNKTSPHAYYDISAKVNLDTKKVNLTIVEHLEISGNGADVQADEKVTTIFSSEEENLEFDYVANVFDYYKNSLSATDEVLRSYNSSLLIQADGEAYYDSADVVGDFTYPENHVFVKEGDQYTILEDAEVGYFIYDSKKQVDLTKTPVSEGIVNVSYRFWPNLYWGSEDMKTATQTFEFGDGFSFDAKWTSFGGGAVWIIDGKFNIGDQTVTMNSSRWNIGASPAGYFRAYNIHNTGAWNTGNPHAYFDISAKINLDTKKVYLTIVEHLEISGNGADVQADEQVTTIFSSEEENMEFDYNADVFDFYKTSISGDDPYFHSLNSRLKIQADGVTAYTAPPELDTDFVERKAVTVETPNGIIGTFEELEDAEAPAVRVNFRNTTGEDLDVYLIIARYGKNGLFSEPLEIKNIRASRIYSGVEYNYNFDKTNMDADMIKIFAWSDITGRTPLKEAAVIR